MSSMLSAIEQIFPENQDWQQLCEAMRTAVTLSAVTLVAWRMGQWFAREIVKQQLAERAQVPTQWTSCPTCGTQLHSKGFVKHQMLTLVGQVEWKRRVGRCPRRCLGSRSVPFEQALGLQAYQQTSIELVRLGCLLAVFLPYNLAAQVLFQLTGISVSDGALWDWIQQFGQQAVKDLKILPKQRSQFCVRCGITFSATLATFSTTRLRS